MEEQCDQGLINFTAFFIELQGGIDYFMLVSALDDFIRKRLVVTEPVSFKSEFNRLLCSFYNPSDTKNVLISCFNDTSIKFGKGVLIWLDINHQLV